MTEKPAPYQAKATDDGTIEIGEVIARLMKLWGVESITPEQYGGAVFIILSFEPIEDVRL